jgi:hypothetical protein
MTAETLFFHPLPQKIPTKKTANLGGFFVLS